MEQPAEKKPDQATDQDARAEGGPETATMPAGLDALEAQFVTALRALLRQAAGEMDGSETDGGEDIAAALPEKSGGAEQLQMLHDRFFRGCMAWTAAALKQARPQVDHPEAIKRKKSGRALIEALQGQLLDFSLCDFDIQRYSHEIRRAARHMPAESHNAQWTADDGIVLARALKQRQALRADNARLDGAQPVLARIEDHLTQLAQALAGLYGADKAEAQGRRLMAALRKGDADAARGALAVLVTAARDRNQPALENALQDSGQAVLTLVSAHRDALDSRDDGKIYLRPAEAAQAVQHNRRELQRIAAFMRKYQQPYRDYKLAALAHLREKLLLAGSLEGLVGLYRRLLAGIAGPMADMNAVRQYESEIVNKIAYLRDTQLSEIPKIRERAATIIAEFRAHEQAVADSAADEMPDSDSDSSS